MQTRNTRLGLVLFAIYLLFYSGFVLLAAFVARVAGGVAVGGCEPCHLVRLRAHRRGAFLGARLRLGLPVG